MSALAGAHPAAVSLEEGVGAPPAESTTFAETAAACLAKAAGALMSLQHEKGYWKGELETNVTMDAEDLLLREFLGVRRRRQTEAAARWIRSQQRADGTWANFYGGPPDLSTTVEAYVALRLAGDPVEADHMRRAAGFILGAGGIERTRVFTRDLVGAVRSLALGGAPGDATRVDVLAEMGAAQHLRLRLLGSPDDRRPHGGGLSPTGPRPRFRHRRASIGCPTGSPQAAR